MATKTAGGAGTTKTLVREFMQAEKHEKQLVATMAKQGMTAAELSRQTGISRQTISKRFGAMASAGAGRITGAGTTGIATRGRTGGGRNGRIRGG
jgi:predicted HTH transcriptional regulator